MPNTPQPLPVERNEPFKGIHDLAKRLHGIYTAEYPEDTTHDPMWIKIESAERLIRAAFENENVRDAEIAAAMQPRDARALEVVEKGNALNMIVEGIQNLNHGTWRDEKGMRLKDTKEWVEFYNALATARQFINEMKG